MCKTYEHRYLGCQRSGGYYCIRIHHVPCESGSCKGEDHLQEAEYIWGSCPEHDKHDDENEEEDENRGEISERGGLGGDVEGTSGKREERPATDCRPM